MRLLLAPRWVRRLVTVPLMFVAFVWVLGLLPVWLVVAAFVSRFVPGRWRVFRLVWFAFVYLLLEVLVLVALLWLWVAAGFGRRLSGERSIRRHHGLMAWFLRRIMNTARFTFGLTMDHQDQELGDVRAGRPVLILSRHAGAGDSFVLVDAVMNGPRPLRPRIVLKDLLQFDPAIDVMLNRIGAGFVGGRSGDAVVDEIVRMSATAAPGDAVVLFPEGGNFTEQRRDRAIGQLLEIGRTDLAERARRFEHLLPPKPKGALAAIAAAPTATVVFVGHAGLEALSTPRDIWRNLPMDHVISTRAWRVHAEDVPPPEQRESWLYDRWDAIDRWIDETLVEHERMREERAATAARARRRIGLRERLGRAVPPLAIAFGLFGWWESLRPSLLPRTPLVQGVVSALTVAVFVMLGTAVRAAAVQVAIVKRRPVATVWRDRLVSVLMFVSLPVVAVGCRRWLRWQREQRRLVALDALSAWSLVPMLLVTAVLVVVLVMLGRLIAHVVAWIDRACARRIRVTLARWVAVATIVAVVVVGSSVAMTLFVRWADGNFGAFDESTAEGIAPPTSGLVSGGPGSLVAWDDLGFHGRNFAGTALTAAALDATARAGVEAVDPVRVYVGLDSAATIEERVALAVAELERTGAFQREVLVVVTPTGTGWVNPDAVEAIEHMHAGDTAVVGVQYSFLPSWIAFLLDTESPRELGRALFDAVHEAWSKQPEAGRARLVVYGESLGSMGGEHAFAGDGLVESVEAIADRTDGALLVGPTRDNPVFRQLVTGRDVASPSWRPVVAEVPNVRVANSAAEIAPGADAWPSPRVLYLHHASDAIGTWAPGNAVSPPGWSDDPPPDDVPQAARWFPVITVIQETFDLMNGFSATPGHGHDYSIEFVDAWAAVAAPEGWTEADTDRLRTALVERDR